MRIWCPKEMSWKCGDNIRPTAQTGRKKGIEMESQTCKLCKNWIDATAECSRHLYYLANNIDVPNDIEKTLAGDSNIDNDCNEYQS